jgi:hypothetical protein
VFLARAQPGAEIVDRHSGFCPIRSCGRRADRSQCRR